MKRNDLLKIIVSFSALLVCLLILPITALASPYEEGQQVSSGDPLYYVNPDDETDHWVVSNNTWHKCIVDNSDNLALIEEQLRQAMVNREDNKYFYLATNNSKNSNLSTDELFDMCDDIIVRVYENTAEPDEGDYLKMMSDVTATNVGGIVASAYNNEYSYYYISFTIKNYTTAKEEQLVKDFLVRWNKEYITDNPAIQSAGRDEKEYLTVKTIYNYIVSNTIYDYEVYRDVEHTQFAIDSVRYRYSHSAYGALFGNMADSYDPSTFDVSSIDISYDIDSQGLYRLRTMDSGLSVCDGYSLVFYYLCKLNGIDVRIVKGDNPGATLDNPDDPHAWNYVYLHDSDDATYEWYQVDATFSNQNSRFYGNDIFAIDYTYFLRGTGNESFLSGNHQQVYSEYLFALRSEDDYKIALTQIDSDKLYSIITRKKEEDSQVIEDYILIFPNGDYYKIDFQTGEYEKCDTFVYNGYAYYYDFNILEFADGVEYQSQSQYIKNQGNYAFSAVNMQSQAFYSHTLTVLPMDMSNWANYDAGLTSRQISSYFNGAYVDIKAEIYDSSSTKLVEGRDYVLRCYAQSDTQRANPIKPYAPGNYMVCIDYYGNYCQTLSYAFTVKKADFSSFSMASVNVRFGTDLVSACSTLKLGATTIYKDKDYSVKVIGGVNYGDEGVIRITGLSGSSYIQSGTYTDRKYKIGSRYDVSSLFNGKLISNPTYMYTGKQIKPDDFVLSYTSNGKKITLVKNKDYSIASYRNNIMSGTGYVTVKFMGNYTGTAEMKFNIECIEFEVSIPDLTYNGKKQKPSPTVKFGGHTLKYATDYTFSSSATDPGIYSCKITGKGQYSKLSITKYYFVKPNTVSSFKATSTATSVKLSWKGQGKNCYYQIYAYDTTKKKWKLIAVTNNTSYTVSKIYTNNKKTALQPNKSYKFRIRAYFSATVNGTKYTKYGGYVSLTQRTKPKTPAFKKVTKGKSYLKFTWGKDSSVNGYELVLATDSKYTKNVQKKTVKKNSTTSYTFKNLKKGKTYYVRIRSYKTVDGKKIYSAYSKTFKIKL